MRNALLAADPRCHAASRPHRTHMGSFTHIRSAIGFDFVAPSPLSASHSPISIITCFWGKCARYGRHLGMVPKGSGHEPSASTFCLPLCVMCSILPSSFRSVRLPIARSLPSSSMNFIHLALSISNERRAREVLCEKGSETPPIPLKRQLADELRAIPHPRIPRFLTPRNANATSLLPLSSDAVMEKRARMMRRGGAR